MDFLIIFLTFAWPVITLVAADARHSPAPHPTADPFFGRLSESLLSLGFDDVGVKLADLLSTQQSQSGQIILEEISEKVSKKLSKGISSVRNLQKVIQESYNASEGQTGQACCEFSETKFPMDSSFMVRVDRSAICNRNATDVGPIRTSAKVIEKMKENLASNEIKWQYYGNKNGFHVTYPARKSAECDNYDPRTRPWYTQGMLPLPKRVVIVLDSNEFMFTDGKNSIARETIKAILKMVSPVDYVGLIYFADHPNYFRIHRKSCYSKTLVKATKTNINTLVDDLETNYQKIFRQPDYADALEKAFEFLKNSEEMQKVILFFSDKSKNTKQDRVDETMHNLPVGTKVFTFGIGDGNSDDWAIHRNMSSSGSFYHLTDENDINPSINSFFDNMASHLPAETLISEKPIFTLPYVDFFGLGLMNIL